MKMHASCKDAISQCLGQQRFGIALLSDEEKPMDMHIHDCYELYLSLSGGKQFMVDSNLYDCRRGDVFVMNQYEAHKPIRQEGEHHERVVIAIHPEFLQALSTRQTDLSGCFTQRPAGFSHRAHADKATRNQLMALLHRCSGTTGFGEDIVENMSFTEIMLIVGGLYAPQQPLCSAGERPVAQPLIGDVLSYINQNITQDLSIEQLATRSYLSSAYLCRLFKRETGTTINKYITARRISLAKRLLAEGSNVQVACSQCGFSDYAHFIRTFGRAVGVSPKQYALRLSHL